MQLGIERNLPDLNGLHSRLETFSTLIYDCLPRAEEQDEVTLTFERFSKLSSEEIVRLLMSGCKRDPTTFIKCLRQSLLPYLAKYDPRHSDGRCQGSLENFLVECARDSLHLVRAVFEQSVVADTTSVHMFGSRDGSKDGSRDGSTFTDTSSVRIITNVKDLLNLASRCINECTNENFLTDAFAIIECLPQRSDSDPAEVKILQDEIDQVENNLAVIELLEKNGCKILMSQLKSIQKNPKDVHRLFTEMIRKGSKRSGFRILDETHWKTLLTEALQARADCFSSTITQNEIHEIFIKTLLSFGREEHFDLAYSLMQSMDTGDLERLILDCSRDYVNSAASTGDKTIGLAKKCLHLLPQDTRTNNPDVKEELDLITALEIIDEFWTLPLLPVQIRLMDQPRIQLIHHLLQSNKIYRQISRVLEVSKLVRIGAHLNDEKEAESMVLITLGEAALDDCDFKSCWNVCEIIMDREYSDGWKLCLNLAFNISCFAKNGPKNSDFGKNIAKFGPNISDFGKNIGDLSFSDFGKNFGDFNQKMALLSFALTHCEDSDGRRMNQILELIESTREEEERKTSSLMKGGSFDLLTGVVSEEVFAKTASHLTSWLIPKFKFNLNADERSKVDEKINYGNENISRSEKISENISRIGKTDERIGKKVDHELIRDQLVEDEPTKNEVISESIKDYNELIRSMTAESDEVDQVESKREKMRQESAKEAQKMKEEVAKEEQKMKEEESQKMKEEEEAQKMKEEEEQKMKEEEAKEEKTPSGWEEELNNETDWDHDEDPQVLGGYVGKVLETEPLSSSGLPEVSGTEKVESLDQKSPESTSGWDFDEPDLESEEQAEPVPEPVSEPTPILVSEPTPILVSGPTPILVSGPTPILVSGPTPILVSGPTPILVSEQTKNEEEATGSASGWDIDEDLELEESTESFPEATPVAKSQEDNEKQKLGNVSGWDIDEDIDPELDLEETIAESELIPNSEPESNSELTPKSEPVSNLEPDLGRTPVPVSNVAIKKEEAKKESESGWDIEDELDLELSDEIVSNPVLESSEKVSNPVLESPEKVRIPEARKPEPQRIEVSEKREEKKQSVHSESASGWDFDEDVQLDDEDLQLDDEDVQLDDEDLQLDDESGWTHNE